MKYEAYNYGMGRVIRLARFEAAGDEEAIRIAERTLPGRHAVLQSGQRVRVLGIRALPITRSRS